MRLMEEKCMFIRNPRECPNCGSTDTYVCNSRVRNKYIIRRRRCGMCGVRSTAYEISKEDFNNMRALIRKYQT